MSIDVILRFLISDKNIAAAVTQSQHGEITSRQTAWCVNFHQRIDKRCKVLDNVKQEWLNTVNIYLRRRIDLLFAPVAGYWNETQFQILISLGRFWLQLVSPLITAAL